MSAQSLFQSLVRDDIAPLLKQLGLKKSGMNFGLRGTDLWGVLTIWRNEWNTQDEVRFSITLNIICDLFRRYNGHEFDPGRVPASCWTHWHHDIGRFLRSDRQLFPYDDFDAKEWWEIRGPGDLEDVRPRVLTALRDVAVPVLRRRRSLAAFVDLWRTEGEPLPGGLFHQVLTLRQHGFPAEAEELINAHRAKLKAPWDRDQFHESLKELDKWTHDSMSGSEGE